MARLIVIPFEGIILKIAERCRFARKCDKREEGERREESKQASLDMGKYLTINEAELSDGDMGSVMSAIDESGAPLDGMSRMCLEFVTWSKDFSFLGKKQGNTLV